MFFGLLGILKLKTSFVHYQNALTIPHITVHFAHRSTTLIFGFHPFTIGLIYLLISTFLVLDGPHIMSIVFFRNNMKIQTFPILLCIFLLGRGGRGLSRSIEAPPWENFGAFCTHPLLGKNTGFLLFRFKSDIFF